MLLVCNKGRFVFFMFDIELMHDEVYEMHAPVNRIEKQINRQKDIDLIEIN